MLDPETSLASQLRSRIVAGGPIPFRDFMQAALYDPDHGYYASGRAAIGRAGDFFTNVSVGPLFGALLARQFEEMWLRLGAPDRFTVVEQGAHRGQFAHDVFASGVFLSPRFQQALEYRFIEPSLLAQRAQRETLDAFTGRASWATSIEELEPFTGVHFSNELLDAFPIHAVSWTGTEWRERYVDVAGGAFAFVEGLLSTGALRQRLAIFTPPATPGFQTEVNLAALDWVAGVAGKLTRGFVLTIDYGFSRDELLRPDRVGGTLTGYAHHRREPDVLARPGEIDLTAHVDFTSLAEQALAAGLSLRGYTDQHHFMVGLSRLHFVDGDAPTEPQQRDLRAFQTLMHPGLMGQSFKVFCAGKGGSEAEPLAGFAFAKDPQLQLGLRAEEVEI